jgi:hypothetical protein
MHDQSKKHIENQTAIFEGKKKPSADTDKKVNRDAAFRDYHKNKDRAKEHNSELQRIEEEARKALGIVDNKK